MSINQAGQCYCVVIKRHEYPADAPKTKAFVDPVHVANAKTTMKNLNACIRACIDGAETAKDDLTGMAPAIHNLAAFIDNPPIVTEEIKPEEKPKGIKWDVWIEGYDGEPIMRSIKPWETQQDAKNAAESMLHFVKADRVRWRIEG